MAFDLLKFNSANEVVVAPEALAIPCFNEVYKLGINYIGYVYFLCSKKTINPYNEVAIDRRKEALIADLRLDAFIIETNPDIAECIKIYIERSYTQFHLTLALLTDKVVPTMNDFLEKISITTIQDFNNIQIAMAKLKTTVVDIDNIRKAVEAIEAASDVNVRGGGNLSAVEAIYAKEDKAAKGAKSNPAPATKKTTSNATEKIKLNTPIIRRNAANPNIMEIGNL